MSKTDRQQGLGGSDLAAVLNLSPWKSPVDIWLEKTGRKNPDVDNNATYWGRRLEDLVAQEYVETTGNKVQRRQKPYVHSKYPFLIGHVDRLVIKGPVLECKTSGALQPEQAGWGEPWTDAIPAYYLTQVLHYIGLSGRDLADVPVFFTAKRDFAIYRVECDQDIIHDLWERAVEWWQKHIEYDEPPEPRSEADTKALFPAHEEKTIIASAEIEDKARELAKTQQERKKLENREKELRDTIIPVIGEAEAITDAQGSKLATYKASKPTKKTDWKAIVEQLDADTEIIQQHTTEKPGSRRFVVKAKPE